MTRPLMAATRVFDFVQMSGYTQTERELGVLLNHFSSPFAALGGTASAVLSEWHRLNRMVLRDDVLRELPLEELYFRAFVHFQYNHFNVLLLAALVQAAAMDVVLAESAMSRLLPCLKSESKHNKGKMLLFMVGHAWQRINAHDHRREPRPQVDGGVCGRVSAYTGAANACVSHWTLRWMRVFWVLGTLQRPPYMGSNACP